MIASARAWAQASQLALFFDARGSAVAARQAEKSAYHQFALGGIGK
jgi:hypothetical protein